MSRGSISTWATHWQRIRDSFMKTLTCFLTLSFMRSHHHGKLVTKEAIAFGNDPKPCKKRRVTWRLLCVDGPGMHECALDGPSEGFAKHSHECSPARVSVCFGSRAALEWKQALIALLIDKRMNFVVQVELHLKTFLSQRAIFLMVQLIVSHHPQPFTLLC